MYYPHRGYFVAELSVADLLEVYRLRALLEAEAIRAAVPTLGDDDVAALARPRRTRSTSAADAGDVIAMTSANRRFHFALFDAAGMPRLSRLLRQLWEATDAYRALYFQAAAQPRPRGRRARGDGPGRCATGTPRRSSPCTTSTATTRSMPSARSWRPPAPRLDTIRQIGSNPSDPTARPDRPEDP